MTELNPLSDQNQNQTPEDVATLYSWANLHGAKYRDFSAARAQTRETARLRAEQALEDEQRRQREEAQAAKAESAQREPEESEAEATRQFELEAAQAADGAANQAAQQAAEQTARMEAEQAARQAAEQAVQQVAQREREVAARLIERQAAQRAAELAAAQSAQPAQPAPPNSAPYFSPEGAENTVRPQAYRPAATERVIRTQDLRAENSSLRNPWPAPDVREPAGRPAWLSTDQFDTPPPTGSQPGSQPRHQTGSQSAYQPPLPQSPYLSPQAQSTLPQAPEDTLQGSRDRLTSRWFALRGVFEGAPAQVEAAPSPVISRAPSLAIFSLAGGVGKTSLVATLGRALSARGERVLLVDTAAFGLLPFFFGATDQRPGLLRTFSPPGVSSDAPIQMITIDPEGLPADQAGMETLTGEILKHARGASRIIVDLATASGATTRRIMRMAPMVLVPVIPDMNSVVSVSSIDAFFEHNGNVTGKSSLPYYVLNQFDASLPLHLDVREVLREQLGDRLLSFALRRTPAMSEALAEGMTVMDYAPGSSLAEDFATLAGWVKSLSAPATTTYRGVRWSER